jgi:arylsulfatase A-like enzyme
LAQGSVSDQVFLSIDLLPTIAHLTETPLPQQSIDGKNIWGLMTRETQMSPHDYYAFTIGPRLESVMSGSGRWKLHLPHNYRTRPSPGSDGMPGKYEQASIDLTLYDLANDPMETQDVKEGYPEVLKKMLGYAQKHKAKFELE